jgi:hypothetical protein
MINIMLKNVDLNDKWWIELIKTINYFRNRFSMIDKSIIFYEIDTKRKIFFCSFSSNRNNRLRYETKINHEMKKIDFKIVFDRARKARKKSHLSNVALQRYHLSYLVCHLNQEKTWKTIRWNRKWNINKTINYWINQILDEKTSFEIEFDNHFHAFVQLINRCRFILLNIIHSESQHIKHRVNFVNFDSQRSETSFRVTLSS